MPSFCSCVVAKSKFTYRNKQFPFERIVAESAGSLQRLVFFRIRSCRHQHRAILGCSLNKILSTRSSKFSYLDIRRPGSNVVGGKRLQPSDVVEHKPVSSAIHLDVLDASCIADHYRDWVGFGNRPRKRVQHSVLDFERLCIAAIESRSPSKQQRVRSRGQLLQIIGNLGHIWKNGRVFEEKMGIRLTSRFELDDDLSLVASPIGGSAQVFPIIGLLHVSHSQHLLVFIHSTLHFAHFEGSSVIAKNSKNIARESMEPVAFFNGFRVEKPSESGWRPRRDNAADFCLQQLLLIEKKRRWNCLPYAPNLQLPMTLSDISRWEWQGCATLALLPRKFVPE